MSTKQRSTRGWVTNGVYSYDILPEVREQVDGLPAQALPCGQPGRQHAEDGLWAGAEGIAVYLILKQQRRVVVLSDLGWLTWRSP